MNITISISVACIAVGFLVLVGYLVMTLKAARASLLQVNETLVQLEGKLDAVSQETVKLMQSTNGITADIQGKMKAMDALFDSIGQVGATVNEVTTSVRQVSATVSDSFRRVDTTVKRERNQIGEWMEIAAYGVQLWRKWQEKRRRPETGNDNNTHIQEG